MNVMVSPADSPSSVAIVPPTVIVVGLTPPTKDPVWAKVADVTCPFAHKRRATKRNVRVWKLYTFILNVSVGFSVY